MKNLSKFLVGTLFMMNFVSGAMAFSVTSGASPQTQMSNSMPFSDVSTGSSYYDALVYLKAQGVVSGYADGTFRPDKTINRAEFTKIVVEAAPGFVNNGLCMETFAKADGTYSDMFNDVLTKDNAWYDNDLCYAKTSNWIGGYPDGSFRPGQNISFVEAAKIIVNANNLLSDNSPGPGTSSQPWYQDYVTVLGNMNAIPTTITSFDQSITRGEMAEIIYRVKAKITNKTSQNYDSFTSVNVNSSTGITSLPHTAGQPIYASCQDASTGNQIYAWFMMGIDTGSYEYYDQNGNVIGNYSYMVPRGSMGGKEMATTNCTAMTQQEFTAVIKDQSTLPIN